MSCWHIFCIMNGLCSHSDRLTCHISFPPPFQPVFSIDWTCKGYQYHPRKYQEKMEDNVNVNDICCTFILYFKNKVLLSLNSIIGHSQFNWLIIAASSFCWRVYWKLPSILQLFGNKNRSKQVEQDRTAQCLAFVVARQWYAPHMDQLGGWRTQSGKMGAEIRGHNIIIFSVFSSTGNKIQV